MIDYSPLRSYVQIVTLTISGLNIYCGFSHRPPASEAKSLSGFKYGFDQALRYRQYKSGQDEFRKSDWMGHGNVPNILVRVGILERNVRRCHR